MSSLKMELQNLMNVQTLVDFDPNGINKLYKLDLANKFMNTKAANPGLNQDQICKMLGTSSSTMKRIRTDLKLNSPYRYDIPLKNNKKKEKSRETKEKDPPQETRKSPIKRMPLTNRKKGKKEEKEELGHGPQEKLFDTREIIKQIQSNEEEKPLNVLDFIAKD